MLPEASWPAPGPGPGLCWPQHCNTEPQLWAVSPGAKWLPAGSADSVGLLHNSRVPFLKMGHSWALQATAVASPRSQS